MEGLLTDMNQGQNKQILENMMMFIMAENLDKRFGNNVDISYIEGNNT